MSDEVRQIFIRNDKGKTWGPLSLPTMELLVENGLIDGRIQLSEDGLQYADPGRFPHLRAAFPQDKWGTTTPGETVPMATPPIPVVAGEGGVQPGAPPVLGGPGPQAGPGANQAATARTAPGAAPPAGQPRPGPGIAQGIPPGAAKAAASGRPPGPPVARPPQAPALKPAAPPVMAPSAPVVAAPPPAAAPVAPPAAGSTPHDQLSSAGDPPPPTGELARHSPIHLYYLAASGDHTGLLTFKLSDRSIDVHFRKGNPEYIGSSHAEDSVAGFLLKSAIASPEQIGKAEAEKARFGGEIVATLFGLGILNPASAFAQLAQHSIGVLMKALLSETGAFTFEKKDLPGQKAMPLGNRWAVLTESVRKLPVQELKRRLTDCLDYPVMKSGGRVQLQDLRLTPQEARALGFIDGVRSLNQLAADLPQDVDSFIRLAFTLRDLEIVSFASVKVAPRAGATAAPAATVAAAPVAPPPPAIAGAPTAAAVTQPTPGASAAAQKAPPASAPTASAAKPGPGVAPAASAATPGPGVTASPSSAAPAGAGPSKSAAPVVPGGPVAPKPAAPVAAAARPPAAPTQPAATKPVAPPAAPAAPVDPAAELKELKERAAKIKDQNLFEILGVSEKVDAAGVKIAYFKLAKGYHPDTVQPNSPPEYGKLKADIFAAVGDAYRRLSDDNARAQYLEDLKTGGSEQVDIQQVFVAEELFQKGQIMVKAKKFVDAVKMLDDAIKANPEEGEFYAWRANAKFFATDDRKLGFAEANKDLAVALKKNPRCAHAYFVQGLMAKILGDNGGALKNFQKTVELQPNHTDAQREVRLHKK